MRQESQHHRSRQHQHIYPRITPELSRPVAGRRTRASVAHSTWPLPRHGVGLNELLGPPDLSAGDGDNEFRCHLAKRLMRRPDRKNQRVIRDWVNVYSLLGITTQDNSQLCPLTIIWRVAVAIRVNIAACTPKMLCHLKKNRWAGAGSYNAQKVVHLL